MHKPYKEFEEIIQFCTSELTEARTANQRLAEAQTPNQQDDAIRAVENHFREVHNKLYKTIRLCSG